MTALIGSIDTNFNQGNFQTTGKKTDLALEGNGFFVLDDYTPLRGITRAKVARYAIESFRYYA